MTGARPRFRDKNLRNFPDRRFRQAGCRAQRSYPNTIAACREPGRRPKSEEWTRGLSERSKKMWENPEAHGLPARPKWTEEELALVGTDKDKVVAKAPGFPDKVDLRGSSGFHAFESLARAGRLRRMPAGWQRLWVLRIANGPLWPSTCATLYNLSNYVK